MQICGQNPSGEQGRTGKLRPFTRHLLRSKSMSAATMTSESYRLEGRERRRKNRVSCEILSDSPSDPFHNPPPSQYCTSPHLIAIAGMRLAIEELDRLSILADQHPRPVALGQQLSPANSSNSSKVAGPSNTPNPTWSGLSSVTPSAPSTPFVPPNSPMSSEDIPAFPSISHGISGKHSRRKRNTRSRLSEISNSPSIPEEPLIPDEAPDFQSFPGFHDSTRQASPVPSIHAAAAHFFNPANLNLSSASELKLAGHQRCESPRSDCSDGSGLRVNSPVPVPPLHSRRSVVLDELSLEGTEISMSWRRIWKQGQESVSTPTNSDCERHTVDCRPESWSPAQREPGSSDFCSNAGGVSGLREGRKSPLGIIDEAQGSTLKENYEGLNSVAPVVEGASRRGSTSQTVPTLERIAQAPGR
ncbi:hypothetical protein B0T16DRAFT_129775 [Cercophora newfieldiana]|uniref:Uncharacterized protein n=1 Tax=Cercophora newfieldiana TaxID=92897 RepID=A0AA39YB39_9PEZI|nr:hypothetical protein B0T16DRAFT_129775 [Cercophora newfieldiana]